MLVPKKLYPLFCLLLFQWALPAQPTIILETFASGLNSPVSMAHAGDDRLFVLEKGGRIRIISGEGVVRETPFLDISAQVDAGASERGLLGLAFHPGYAENGYFFVNYTDNDGNTRIARFRRSAADPDLADPASEQLILSVEQPRTNHNGGDLAFGPDGYLYIALGDGGGSGDPDDLAQNRSVLLGKILRIDINTTGGEPYAIPPDNPFVDDPNTRDEIWALGLRNPWRFSFDRQTNDFWIADVGQGEWEEVNFQPAGSPGGQNYGWHCYEGNAAFNTNDCLPASQYAAPIHVYGHRSGNCGGSVTGGFVYRGSRHPDLGGHYVYADYCTGRIYSLVSDGAGGWTNNELLSWEERQIVSFGEDAAGELLLAAVRQGVIYRLRTTVSGRQDAGLGLSEVRISPNPLRQTLHIRGKSDRRGDFEILLYDAQGRLVFRQKEPFPSSFSKTYEVDRLAPGVYLLQIRQGEQSRNWRVVKQ